MPTAKEMITMGFTVVALPGGYVSKDAVKTYGWEKLVDDGPDMLASDQAPDATAQIVQAEKKKS